MSGWQDSNLRPPGPKPGAMTGLRYTPNNKNNNTNKTKKGTSLFLSCDPEAIRTLDLLLRRQLLYPAELRSQYFYSFTLKHSTFERLTFPPLKRDALSS